MTRRYLIIGSGAAGLSAAEGIRERDAGGTIALLSEESHPPYSRPGIAYLISRSLPERQLQIRTAAELADLGIERVTARAVAMAPEHHQVIDSAGTTHTYDRLLIATGSRAVPPPFEGGGLDGVLQLDGLDDARAFLRHARRARTAIVVGGGPTAIELIEGLRAHRVRTHYFMRRDRYWSAVLDAAESQLVHDKLAGEGIVLHPHTEIARVLGAGGRVQGIETTAGERIGCDLVCVAIGVVPRTDFVPSLAPRSGGGIPVDEQLSAGGDIFAAGDVARIRDPLSGELTGDVLWSSAVEQGRIAGANMAGATLRYSAGISLNVTRLCGITTTVIGRVGGGDDPDLVSLSRGESRRWHTRPRAWTLVDRDGYDRLRVIAGERRLIGAVVMGDQGLSRALVRAIRRDLDLGPVWEQLLADRDHALPTLIDFVVHAPEVQRASRAA